MLYRLGAHVLETADERYWVAPNATLIGKVRLERDASVWFGAVLRGDNELITVGAHSNVQDGAVLHTDPGFPLIIGNYVTVGHKAMVHGCEIGDNSLIGINAVVLNGAKIGRNCLIGANALITEGKQIPDNSMVLGAPGKVIRELNEREIQGLRRSAEGYARNARRFRQGLKPQLQADPES